MFTSKVDQTKDSGPYATSFSRLLKTILALVAIVIAGYAAYIVKKLEDGKSMEPTTFTQCFKPLASPWPFSREDEFYRDPERGCNGQRWSMPKAYFLSLSHSLSSETLEITVARPGLGPGKLLPSDQYVPLLHDIKIMPAQSKNFHDHIAQTQDAYRTTIGLAKTGRELHGMELYEGTKKGPYLPGDFFLFPWKNAQLFVRCILLPGQTSPDQKKPNQGCRVIANVDNRVSVEYDISYSQISDLPQINAKLVGLVRSFMINEKNTSNNKNTLP